MNSVQACCACHRMPSSSGGAHKKCGGCQIPLYCGKICQKEHWRKVHKNHCKLLTKEDNCGNGVSKEFMEILNGDKRFNMIGINDVQNPLRDTEDILDNKLGELCLLGSALEQKYMDQVKRIRLKYWLHVLVYGNSFSSINMFLFGIFRLDILPLAREIFETNDNDGLHKTSVPFMFNVQMLLIAADYSIPNIINVECVEDSEDEHVEALKRRKKEASDFFSCWQNFSDSEGFLLLSKANCFLMKAASLETCFICKSPVPIKSCSWACAVEKTQDIIKSSLVDCSAFYRMLDGLGSVTCCGKMDCNLEIQCLFQRSLTDLKLTIELARFRPDLIFQCDFCYRKSSVHRCSVCKSRWYCGEDCQLNDWKVVHKEVCGKLSKMGRNQRLNSQKRKDKAEKVTKKNINIHENELMDKLKKDMMECFV